MNEQDERIIEVSTEGLQTMKQPNCPRCRFEPLEFACNVVRTQGGHLVSVIWCGHCGHTMSAQFVGMDQPQGPRIVSPS